MRKVYGAALALAIAGAATGTANAADLTTRPIFKPTVPVAPAFSWTGFYVGAHAGYGWGQDTTKEFITATMGYVGLQNTFRPNGFLGGLHAGVNYQMGAIVLGLEGDVDFADIKGGFVDPPAPPANPGGRGNTKLDLQGSMRARLGYAFGPAMFYATGGLTMGHIKSTYFNWPGVGESFTRTVLGYSIGGGLEYAITSSISARAEYRFTQYELFKNNSQLAFPGFTGTQEPYYHTTRIGLSYRF